MKIFMITLLALGTILGISACGTLHGAGQDVRTVGRGIENAADAR
jgi:predicted small secreted protein